jgi:translation initiation factor IF-2
LETYKPDITKTTPAIVVVNKMDLLLFNSSEDDGNNAREGASSAEAIKKTISASITKAIGSLGKDASLWEIVFASGKTGENVDEVLEAASRAWKRMNSSASRSNYISSSDDESESDAAKAESVWSDPNRF